LGGDGMEKIVDDNGGMTFVKITNKDIYDGIEKLRCEIQELKENTKMLKDFGETNRKMIFTFLGFFITITLFIVGWLFQISLKQ
jgi:hypothetical protein